MRDFSPGVHTSSGVGADSMHTVYTKGKNTHVLCENAFESQSNSRVFHLSTVAGSNTSLHCHSFRGLHQSFVKVVQQSYQSTVDS